MTLYSNFKFSGLFLVTIFSLMACNNDTIDDLPVLEDAIVWTGTTITFEKAEGSDPDLENNQDRITDNVWITRNNDGGQIYNVQAEKSPDKDDSPTGTLWAEGTIDMLDDLTFKPFRETVDKPKQVVGKDLVLYLVEDQIYMNIKFTKWSSGKAGGFAYERSSQ